MTRRERAIEAAGRVTWACMVNHDRVGAYLRCGWMIGERFCGTARHHRYGIILVWPCACKVVEP